MISNARPPIGTGTPRARSSRRARSTSHSSNSYTSRRPCACTRGPRSGYLTFHQNLAVRKSREPAPRRPTTVAVSCVEVADRFPGKAYHVLRNTQNCFKELPCAAGIEHRHGMAYGLNVFYLVTFLHPTRRVFPIKKS